jgi:hypothetical protein
MHSAPLFCLQQNYRGTGEISEQSTLIKTANLVFNDLDDDDFGSGIEHLVKSLVADEPTDANLGSEHSGLYLGQQYEHETRSASIATYEPLEAVSTDLLRTVSYAVND